MAKRRADGTLYPVFDPNSTKYPDRVFYGNKVWMTLAQIEHERKHKRERWAKDPEWSERKRSSIRHKYKHDSEWASKQRERARKWNKDHPEKMRSKNARKVRIKAGGMEFYIGMAPTVQDAQRLLRKIKEEAPK